MFRIVKDPAWMDWYQVNYNSTCYVGQLVKIVASGIEPLPAAAAGPAVIYPFGVIVGFNDQVPVYDSTYKNDKGVAVATIALMNARKWTGQGGMTSKREGALMAQVAIIDSDTVLQGDIFTSTYGTAPSVVTCTTASALGATGMVHSASDAASVAYMHTYCGRSGLNRGFYRVPYSTSTTTPTFYLAWPNPWTIGDTYVVANLSVGRSKLQTDAQGTFIDNSGATSSNYYDVDVYSMNLEVAGKETATFRFRL